MYPVKKQREKRCANFTSNRPRQRCSAVQYSALADERTLADGASAALGSVGTLPTSPPKVPQRGLAEKKNGLALVALTH